MCIYLSIRNQQHMCMYSQLHGNVFKNDMHVQLPKNTYNFAPTTLPPSNATVAPLT
jgi:hypothetical protein